MTTFEEQVRDYVMLQEDRVYHLWEHKQLLAEEYNAHAYTKEEYHTAIKEIDRKGFKINQEMAKRGLDSIYF